MTGNCGGLAHAIESDVRTTMRLRKVVPGVRGEMIHRRSDGGRLL